MRTEPVKVLIQQVGPASNKKCRLIVYYYEPSSKDHMADDIIAFYGGRDPIGTAEGYLKENKMENLGRRLRIWKPAQ